MSSDESGYDVDADYGILGCGSVGYAVAEELYSQGKDVVILDRDESRVKSLRDQDMNAIQWDITDPKVAEMLEDVPVVLVLTSLAEENRTALQNLRENNPDQYIIVRASDPVSQEEFVEKADSVINPPSVISDSALRELETGELEQHLSDLVNIIHKSSGKTAVLMHDRIDDDLIASAAVLEKVADRLGGETDVLYDVGEPSQSNRAFINLLDFEVSDKNDVEMDDYDSVLVLGRIENPDELDFDIDLLISHHDLGDDDGILHTDVRSNVGSISTIMTKYIQEIDINLSTELMTGLLHGIRSGTKNFRFDTTPADLTSAAYLYPFSDQGILNELELPSMSEDELDILAESIQNREIYGSNLVSNVGYINEPDTLLRAADNLLNLDSIDTTAVYGVIEENIYVAARSDDVTFNVADTLDDALENADVAGDSKEATALIDLGIFQGASMDADEKSQTLLELIDEAISKKVLGALGIEDVN
ncbi:MAG: DHH family phosphoesterase [Halobacteria archaeon]